MGLPTFAVEAEEKQHQHVESHFRSSELVRDVIIGMADGLTVPVALAAGLTGATSSSTLVVTAGLAEVAAGAIAMGLGGYLAAKSDADHYWREEKRERQEIVEVPEQEADEVAEILTHFGLRQAEYAPIVASLCSRPEDWLQFMMKFELGLEKPDPRRALKSAATIGLSYVVGGLIPLTPYIAISRVEHALYVSVALTLVSLFGFGYFKGFLSGTRPLVNGLQTVLVGALASAAAFGLARVIQVIHYHDLT